MSETRGARRCSLYFSVCLSEAGAPEKKNSGIKIVLRCDEYIIVFIPMNCSINMGLWFIFAKNKIMIRSVFSLVFGLIIFSFGACNNLSEQVESKLNILQNKTDSLDALINQEIEKVTNLDSLINTEHNKVKKLDSVIQKTGERIDSFTGNKAKQIERLVR